MRRLPADVIDLTDRLGCKFGNGAGKQDLGAACAQRYDLRIDGRISGLVGEGGYDQLVGLVAQPIMQAGEKILARIVVLSKDRDLVTRQVFEDVASIDAPLGRISWAASPSSRESAWDRSTC